MQYQVILKTPGRKGGFGSDNLPPNLGISGNAVEIIEWAIFNNMKFVPNFNDFIEDSLVPSAFTQVRPYENGFALFTLQHIDATPLSQEECIIFDERTCNIRGAGTSLSYDDLQDLQMELLGVKAKK